MYLDINKQSEPKTAVEVTDELMKKNFKLGDIINNKAQPGLVGIVIGRKSVGRKFHKKTMYTVLTFNKKLNYVSKAVYYGPDEWVEVVGHFNLASILQPLDKILNETSDSLFPETKDVELHLSLRSSETENIINNIINKD